MYIIVYLLILFCILIITNYKYKTVMKPNILFTLVWTACAALSSIGLYDLYKPSSEVHLYIITLIFGFNLAYIVNNNCRKKSNFNFDGVLKSLINVKLIYFTNFISWIYMYRFLSKAIPIIKSRGFNALRLYAFDSSMGLGSTIELTIAQIFVQSIFIATIVISAFYFNCKREHKGLVIISIIDVAIYTISFAGRGMLTSFIAYNIIFFVIIRLNSKFKKTKKSTDKKRKNNFFAIVIGLVMMIYLTNKRGWGETNFIKELYYYAVGPFSFLEVLLQEGIGNFKPLLYGKATFGFIFNLIIMPLAYIFKFNYLGSDYLITSITSTVRFISPNMSYNALTTMIYPFMRDFGYIGILVGGVFFALFISVSEKKYKKENNLFFLLVYSVLIFDLFNSIKNYYLLNPSWGMTIIMLYIFTKKIRIKRG